MTNTHSGPRWLVASGNPGKLRELQAMLAPRGVQLVSQKALGIADAEEPWPTFVENALAKARHGARASGLPTLADDSGLCVPALGGAPGVRSARFALDVITDPARRAALQGGGREALDAENIVQLLAQCRALPAHGGAPGGRVPGAAVPGAAVPGAAVPGGRVTDDHVPEAHVAGGTIPLATDSGTGIRAYFYSILVWVASADDPRPLIAEGIWWGSLLPAPQGEGGFGYDPIFRPDGFDCSSAELTAAQKNAISHRHRAMVRLQALLDEVAAGGLPAAGAPVGAGDTTQPGRRSVSGLVGEPVAFGTAGSAHRG